jgi:hypothetical protein
MNADRLFICSMLITVAGFCFGIAPGKLSIQIGFMLVMYSALIVADALVQVIKQRSPSNE